MVATRTTTDRRSSRRSVARVWTALLCVFAGFVGGCRSYDDARVLQVLNQRGFGRRAAGNSNEILTIGIGDTIAWSDPINVDINGQGVVIMDGTIFVPLIGHVHVNGLTTDEIARALEQRYTEYYKAPRIFARVVGPIMSKRFYMRGEVLAGGALPFQGDTFVWDAIMSRPIPITADLSHIEVIRADPLHPLVIPIDLEQMLDYGVSRDNIEIREDDIIVVHPNFVGHIANLIKLILAPIRPLVQLGLSVNSLQFTFDSFTGDQNFQVGNRFNGGFNNFNAGGGGGGTNTLNTTDGLDGGVQNP